MLADLLLARRATLSRYATRPTSSPQKNQATLRPPLLFPLYIYKHFFPNCAWQWPIVLVHRATARRHTASHINNMYSHTPYSKPCYRYLLVTQPGHAEQAPRDPVVYLISLQGPAIENFRIFENGPNVKVWVSGDPKMRFFFKTNSTIFRHQVN